MTATDRAGGRADLEREIKEDCGLLSHRLYCDAVFKSCNGNETENFTNVKMEIKPRKWKSAALLRDLYYPGFQKVLDDFKQLEKGLVESLMAFLEVSDTDAQAISKVFNKKNCTEAEVVAVLAVHLFGKLTKAAVIVSANFANLKKLSHVCPCGCGARFHTGNTGLGSPNTWHGFPDILVNGVSVKVTKNLHQGDGAGDSEDGEEDDDEDGDQDEGESSSEDDEPSAPKRLHTIEELQGFQMQTVAKQVLAQTITNSFIQVALNDKLNHRFVPSILCSPEGVLMFGYNVKNDLLLHTEDTVPILQTDSVEKPRFSLTTLLEIWLALHVQTTGCDADIFLDTEEIVHRRLVCLSKSGFNEMMPEETLQEYKTACSRLSSVPTKVEVNIFEHALVTRILRPRIILCKTSKYAQSGETQEQVQVAEQVAK